MDVNFSCEVCGFEAHADETDGPGAEHIANIFTAIHTAHTPEQINSYIWANGRGAAEGMGDQ